MDSTFVVPSWLIVAELTPVWRIETDAGALIIDAESGKAEGQSS